MQEFKTNELNTRKRVIIDGHEYVVRRMGNIEQLETSQAMRRLTELANKETQGTKLTKAEISEVDEISKRSLDTIVSLFDDGEGFVQSRKMIGSLTDEEVKLLIDRIFAREESGEEPS